VGAVPQDARERVVSLVVDNNSLEGPASGEEGGHGNGPRKGPLDGLACEQPSTRSSRRESEDRSAETQDSGSVLELGTVDDNGVGSSGERVELDDRIGSVRIKRPESSLIVSTTIDGRSDGIIPISVSCKGQSGGARDGAALELRSAAGLDSDARPKTLGSGKTLGDDDDDDDVDDDDNDDDDDDDDDDELPASRRICTAHRHRVPCHVARAQPEPACRRDANRSRPCRVHDRRRDYPRGKSAERTEHLRFHNPENGIVRLEQDPILHPVRILGCPAAEGQEVSSFLQPAGPSYVYTSGIGVDRFAGGEPYCFALHNPDNILPKSRAGSIARFLDGPNRAVKDINRKVLAMARAMTPVWSLRLLGVSCGSVVCAWGLLLILSVLGGTSHGTGIGNFGPDSMSGKMDDLNGVRCPWACTCGGQEVDCSHRGLTQIPGDLASLLIAEKL